jgi:hypothetical protein
MGSARNKETVKERTTKVNRYLYRTSSGQQGEDRGKGEGDRVEGNVCMEEECSCGNRWLILLPWLVVGSRYRGFLVGRRLGARIGPYVWWLECNRCRKDGLAMSRRAGGSVTCRVPNCEVGTRERVKSMFLTTKEQAKRSAKRREAN